MDLTHKNYLDILHQKIQEIVNIDGISENKNGGFSIGYTGQPTEEQLSEINNIIESWPLEKAKLEKLELVDTEWTATLANGWSTPYGWKLGLDIQDVALLNGNFTLAKEAANLGITDPVFVIDTDGEAHEFNLQDLTLLMLQYGQARAALSSQDAAKRKAIKNATSIEDLNNL
jgi:hypothetical protein